MQMLVLGIETSCDETSAAIVKNGHEVLSNEIASQASIHKKYGGVFPEIACRSHVDMIIPVVDLAIKNANIKKEDIELIAATKGPGLIGALLIGLNTAKALSFALNIPFIGINHLEAHIYASMMDHLDNLKFPSLGIVISGGHTVFVKILNVGSYQLIGKTVDDSIGEAFDKVAKILGLPYPGGEEIEKLAKLADPNKFDFKPSVVKKRPFDFSFSGLKTKVLYTVKGQNSNKTFSNIINEEDKKDIAASFQRAALQDIVEKAFLAIETFKLQAIYIGGGVSKNKKLKEMFQNKNMQIPIYWPKEDLFLDNGAMIAGLGFQKFKKNYFKKDNLLSTLPLSKAPLC